MSRKADFKTYLLAAIIAIAALGIAFLFDNSSEMGSDKSFWNEVKLALGYPSQDEQGEDLEEPIIPDEPVEPTEEFPESYPTHLPESFPTEPSLPTDPSAQPGKIKPEKILIVGDSMILEGLGPRLDKELRGRGFKVTRKGKYSSGLSNTAKINWPVETNALLNQSKYDVLIVMLGTNDGQRVDGIPFGAPGWEAAYRRKAAAYFNMIAAHKNKPTWVVVLGQPIAKSNDFNRKFVIINSVQKDEASKHAGFFYVDAWDRFAKNGQFSLVVADDAGKRGNVKYSDGVHLAPHGAKIYTEFLITQTKEIIEF